MTVPMVTSALHRARTALRKHYHQTGPDGVTATLADQDVRELLDQFVRAWESADVARLVSLLREDATFSMPPWPGWYRGRAAIGVFMRTILFAAEPPTRWRSRITRANGQPAIALYRQDDPDAPYTPCSIQVLTLVGSQIADVTNFKDPSLFPRFGFLLELEKA